MRGETEAIAKAHAAIAGQMKRELEEPLLAFAGGNKERRKIIQNGIERIHKTKMQQTQTVNKVNHGCHITKTISGLTGPDTGSIRAGLLED